jgi:hypothetical protein
MARVLRRNGRVRHNPGVTRWLRALRIRVLLPLVGSATFAAAVLCALAYSLCADGSPAVLHAHWRELLYGSVLVTLGAVTGIKVRGRDPESASS